jgi:hypothetical protein
MRRLRPSTAFGVCAMFALFIASTLRVLPQSAELQAQVADLKQAATTNQQALAQYTWEQQETVSVNGKVQKQALYQVHLGTDGKPVKTEISQGASSGGIKRHGIRHRIEASYEEYGKQLATLAQSYANADPASLQQRYAQGDVALKPAGASGLAGIVVSNYVKPGDSVTFNVDRSQKALVGMNVATYVGDPSDKATIAVQFARLPDGTNHVSMVDVDGVSKKLDVREANMNYQKH